MSNYRVYLEDVIDKSGNSRLTDVLNIVDRDDKLLIVMDENDLKNATLIFNALESNGFYYSSMEPAGDNKYNITARRR